MNGGTLQLSFKLFIVIEYIMFRERIQPNYFFEDGRLNTNDPRFFLKRENKPTGWVQYLISLVSNVYNIEKQM